MFTQLFLFGKTSEGAVAFGFFLFFSVLFLVWFSRALKEKASSQTVKAFGSFENQMIWNLLPLFFLLFFATSSYRRGKEQSQWAKRFEPSGRLVQTLQSSTAEEMLE